LDNDGVVWDHLQHILKALMLADEMSGCHKCQADLDKEVAECTLCCSSSSSTSS
jgi:hypothetical protein